MEEKVYKNGFTHAGKFHSDDVFSTALLKLLFPKIKIQRGFSIPEDFDGIVYDIGFGRYDHHQVDKEVRPNGVPYAAFGLLWRDFGECFLDKEHADEFDRIFIQPLDESDNTGSYCDMAQVIDDFNPVWDEKIPHDVRFWEAVGIAKKILKNHFNKINSYSRADSYVKEAMDKCDGRVLVLERYLPWKTRVVKSDYEVVIYPSNRGGYGIQMVPVSGETTDLKVHLPEEWYGKSVEELRTISGIDDLTFCHATGFLASTLSLEGALKVAQKAK
jgi:uncharacterized UPF0160 family protein